MISSETHALLPNGYAEMLSCFFQQSMLDQKSIEEEAFKRNCSLLITLIDQSLQMALPIIHSLEKVADQISTELAQVSKVLTRLDFILITGMVESARIEDGENFNHLFNEIGKQVEQSKALFVEFTAFINNIIKETNVITQDCTIVTNGVISMKKEIFSLKISENI